MLPQLSYARKDYAVRRKNNIVYCEKYYQLTLINPKYWFSVNWSNEKYDEDLTD